MDSETQLWVFQRNFTLSVSLSGIMKFSGFFFCFFYHIIKQVSETLSLSLSLSLYLSLSPSLSLSKCLRRKSNAQVIHFKENKIEWQEASWWNCTDKRVSEGQHEIFNHTQTGQDSPDADLSSMSWHELNNKDSVHTDYLHGQTERNVEPCNWAFETSIWSQNTVRKRSYIIGNSLSPASCCRY